MTCETVISFSLVVRRISTPVAGVASGANRLPAAKIMTVEVKRR